MNLLVQNKEKKIVTGFISNDDGEFPQLSIYDHYIQYLTFSWIGSREISIPADSLFGYRTEIEVHLKESAVTYYNPDMKIYYLITRRSRDRLELKSLVGKQEQSIILRKL
ncbi:hypothetical protein GILI108418_02380 [Gillisia limnaea]|uniref:Uncharacterized protein n=1 Tax=Gillisia limnaea (strain DSM 15749 / LMG 21470 / R-8282) TaxID=865937 RepID=H2BWN4_GILLR|nr:hypothetical protein Gilli_2386 [Gillisia limnaea DSM 15749]